MTEQIYLVRYGEMFLKSKSVLKYFISKLKNNLDEKIKLEGIEAKTVSFRDRLYIKAKENEFLKIENILAHTFGVHSFSLIYKLDSIDLEKIELFVKDQFKDFIKKRIPLLLDHINLVSKAIPPRR